MLYQWFEWQRQLMLPAENWARHLSSSLRHPFNPFAGLPATEWVAGFCDRYANTQAQYHHPDFHFSPRQMNGKTVSVENTIVAQTPFCWLRRFRWVDGEGKPIVSPAAKKRKNERIFLVSPISGNYAVVFNDAVSLLLECGEVYVTDWIDAREIPLSAGRFGLEENVTHLCDFFAEIAPTHLLAFSQSSNPTLIALAFHAQKTIAPQSLTILGGPIDTRVNPGVLGAMLDHVDLGWLETHLIQSVPYGNDGAGRRVFPGFLQHAGFMGLHWDRHVKAHWKQVNSAINHDSEQRHRMERTSVALHSVMDMCAEHYLDNIKHFFVEHNLVEGRLCVRGQKVPLSSIRTTRVLTIEGERDNLCPPGQTSAVVNLLPSLPRRYQKHLVIPNCGHFGLVGGRHFQKNIYPEIRDWILQQPSD